MAGVSNILNIAKEALLAQQLAIQVSGHNVANVNTPGFSRQQVGMSTNIASEQGVGFLGNGVQADKIERVYDQFIVQRLSSQNSTVNFIDTQQQSMKILESTFNEAPGLAINDMLNKFWEGMQTLSNNPEDTSARQTVVQQAGLLIGQFQTTASEITQTRSDIDSNLSAGVANANSLTRQIAELNGKLSGTETANNKQNDLRDQRDQLVQQLSGLLNIDTFETTAGTVQILLADGRSLVEGNEQSDLDWKNGQLFRLAPAPDGSILATTVSQEINIGGKIGGGLEIRKQLVEGDPSNWLGQLDSLVNSLVREVNQQHSQGVGLIRFSTNLTGSESARNTALLQSTVSTATATDAIIDGAIRINDRSVGRIAGASTSNGLAMGKAANTAVAINEAITGVHARLTTLTAGNTVADPMAPGFGLAAGENVSFSVNGITVDYTAPALETANETATNVAAAINTAITAYNLSAANTPKMTIQALVGDGTNGGAVDSLVLRNTIAGDQSRIVIAGVDPFNAGEAKLGLTDGTSVADATHNTGELSLFSAQTFTIDAGTNDTTLAQLGLAGGNKSLDDADNDGKITFRVTDNAVLNSLQGFDYVDQLQSDSGSFNIWLYTAADNIALPQPVTVSLERATTLSDVVNAINISLDNATNNASPRWLTASISGDNKLVLTPDGSHQFAFGNDTSNFLATAGVNTIFSGHSSSTIGINQTVANNVDFLAAGTINSHGEIFSGDNSNVLNLAAIQTNEFIEFTGGKTQTLDSHYNSLVADIGLKGLEISKDLEFNNLIFTQMNEMRDATAGVSLDEEMSNLIKFQHAYQAAAKLISGADEMMKTLLQAV